MARGAEHTAERTMWVPPQVGSLLGGGFVRVAEQKKGTDERALISAIRQLNVAEMSPQERLCAISAVARMSGMSERQLRQEQDRTGLPLGEWLAFNSIARFHQPTFLQLVVSKGRGKSWSELAKASGISLATVVETLRQAGDLTATTYANNAERAKGDGHKWRELGVHPQKFL